MRSTPEPQDRDLTLGAPIRPAAPAPADTVKPFETGDWAPKGLVITDKPAPLPADPLDVRSPGLPVNPGRPA